MDDIAACIKDHQYNEAIRKTTVDPVEALAKAIIDRMPEPGNNASVLPIEEFTAKLTLESMSSCALGRYFLGMVAKGLEPSLDEKAVKRIEKVLDETYQFSTSNEPTRKAGLKVLKHLRRFSMKTELDLDGCLEAAENYITSDGFEKDRVVALGVFDKALTAISTRYYDKPFSTFKDSPALVLKYRNVLWYRDREVSMDDFVVFRDLGRGAFGVVSGARHRVTGQMVALKCMNRKLVKGKKVLKMVKAEFEILKKLGDQPSPFCVSLRYSFMDPTDLYLGLPLCTGGDLAFHLRTFRKGFGIERARFFAAEILLGLEHLHNLGILYRDLKPENVLLEDDGHTKISDLGLAVLTGYTPHTIGNKTMSGRAGTPGYWPPEMIKKTGYAFDADWWSYGVLLYELLTGVCTFSESHTKCRDRNDATLTWEIEFPDKCDTEAFPESAKTLILALLDRTRETRLGAKPDCVEQIKEHEFFKDIQWDAMSAVKVTPPWQPPGDSINAASQEELQERSKEHEFKRLKLTDEDNIEGINYSSRFHEHDLITVLELQSSGRLKHLDSKMSSAACTLL